MFATQSHVGLCFQNRSKLTSVRTDQALYILFKYGLADAGFSDALPQLDLWSCMVSMLYWIIV